MTEFSTSALLELEVDQASLRDARATIEEEVGTVTVDVDAGGGVGGATGVRSGRSGIASGGVGTDGGQNLQSAQLEKLGDIHDELETMGVSGGLGSGAAAAGAGGGLASRLPSIGAGAVLTTLFGKGTLLGGSMVLGAMGIDKVGETMADMTSEQWSNLLFGQAGGLVPQGFWDDQAEGISMNEATIAVGSAAFEGLADALTDDGGQSSDDMTGDTRGRQGRNQSPPGAFGWERQSRPNQPDRDTGKRDRLTEDQMIELVLEEMNEEYQMDVRNRFDIRIDSLGDLEGLLRDMQSDIEEELYREFKGAGTFRTDTRQGPI